MTVSIVGTMTGVRPRARGGGGGGGSGTTTGTRTADTGLSIVDLMTLTQQSLTTTDHCYELNITYNLIYVRFKHVTLSTSQIVTKTPLEVTLHHNTMPKVN